MVINMRNIKTNERVARLEAALIDAELEGDDLAYPLEPEDRA